MQDHHETDEPIEPIPTAGPEGRSPERQAELIAEAYAGLRRRSDRTLAQLAIGDLAAELAESVIGVVAHRTGAYDLDDVDAAARLVDRAQELLKATVRAARLNGRSWDAIGEAVTGESGKRQTMINRYGDLEKQWRDALLEPVDREVIARPYTIYGRLPEGLGTDTEAAERWLRQFLAKRDPGAELELPQEKPSSRIADYTWRLNAAVAKYGVRGIPAELAADLDARKAAALGEGGDYLASTQHSDTDEEA